MKDNELRDIFQNKLANHSSPVPDRVWASVQSGMAGSVATTSASSWLVMAKFWWIAAATAAVIGGATLLYVRSNADIQNPSATQPNSTSDLTTQLEEPVSSSSVSISAKGSDQNKSQSQLSTASIPAPPEIRPIHFTPVCDLIEESSRHEEKDLSAEKRVDDIVEIDKLDTKHNPQEASSAEGLNYSTVKLTAVRFAPDQLKYLFISSVDAENFEEWDFGDGQSSSEFSVSHEYETDGNYTVAMRTRDLSGELVETKQQVPAYHQGKLEMPNIFTPNDDGSNDTFGVMDLSKHIREVNYMVIKSKDGELVYESNSSQPWDGISTRGAACEQGSYLYSIVATDVAGNTLEKQGVVVLKR